MKLQYISILLLLLLTPLNVFAVPARRCPATLTQPDGSRFTATLKGDEYQNLLLTADGHAVVQDADGWYCYATFEADGSRHSSGVHVGDPYPAPADIPYAAIASAARARRQLASPEEENLMRRLNRLNFSAPALTRAGTQQSAVKHGIVILAQFQDIQFRFTREDFVNMLTQEGYSVNGATGSAKEYFDSQFNGMYDFQFDVSKIVTVSKNRAWYGANNSNGNDVRPEEMVIEACRLVDADIDFSLYDDDGDGEVDNVFVFFAGGDAAEYAGDDCIWSHAWYIRDGAGKNLSLDGKVINRYACGSECTTKDFKNYNLMAPIGTFCHEYSHTMGLADLYDTDGSDNGQSDGVWYWTSLMDGGNMNNGGNTPPFYNALEREMLGIAETELLPVGNVTMSPISQGGVAYRIPSNVEGEYYLLEFRYPESWDKYVGGKGLLVYHVDRSETIVHGYSAKMHWDFYNTVNCWADRQCMDLLEANPSAQGQAYSRVGQGNYYIGDIFFPYGSYSSINGSGPHKLEFWNGSTSLVQISAITLNDKILRMSVSGEGSVEVPPVVKNLEVERFQTSAILNFSSSRASSDATAVVEWNKIGSSDVMSSECEAYSPGLYAIRIDGLQPKTAYEVRVFLRIDGIDGEIETYKFISVSMPDDPLPFIYLKNVERNTDGSFCIGCRLPLVAGGVPDCESVRWYYSGREIKAGPDCYFHPSSSGELKADIRYADGSHDLIVKYINIVKQ